MTAPRTRPQVTVLPLTYVPAAGGWTYGHTGVVPLTQLSGLCPEQQAFEKLLREAPDATAVAVYSDWCEEHGLLDRAAWLRAVPPAVALTALQRYQYVHRMERIERLTAEANEGVVAAFERAARALMSVAPSLAPLVRQTLQGLTRPAPTPSLGESNDVNVDRPDSDAVGAFGHPTPDGRQHDPDEPGS